MKQTAIISLLLMLLMTSFQLKAENYKPLTLPNRELLSSDKVLYVMQDAEGYLWYATEGGGVCRDDGRQVDVFRSDADHPDLLGSNNVVSLGESGRYIIIGTSHGAYLLDKKDYGIRRMKEVDDKRVDDIVVSSKNHWWLTSNKKVYEYSPDGNLLNIYPAGDKYIFRMREDRQGRLWCTEWEGGTYLLDGGRFILSTSEWPDSVSFSRMTTDSQGRRLVADGFGECYALSSKEQERWFDGEILTRETADSVQQAWRLSQRPAALAFDKDGNLWFSTGKEIRRMLKRGEETCIDKLKDVSAMSFTSDGTLWLATIFGRLYHYASGKAVLDEYGSNEYGDGVRAMEVDSIGRLVLVYDRYTRIYDIRRQTMRQQSHESAGTYIIELQETASGERWSQPPRDAGVLSGGRPVGWWLWAVCALLAICTVCLVVYIGHLRRQRRQFLAQMRSLKTETEETSPAVASSTQHVPTAEDKWVQKAISCVESHMSEDGYTVEQLSSELCMSRMTFYRKIQSATGHTPTEFIRTIRLRRAAELLRQSDCTITEIAYATGFSSVSYFSRCFRTMFGMPPTQFGSHTTADDLCPSEMPS